MSRSKLINPREAGRTCPFCVGRHFELLHEWGPDHSRNSATVALGYWQCDCGLAFLDPVPTPDQLPQDGDWWSPQRKSVVRHWRFKVARTRVQDYFFGTAQQRFIRQTQQLVPQGDLLDVGCGEGQLLEYARPHFTCHGLEPSALAAVTARERGFQILESTLDGADLPANRYHVVTMDAVLEHLLDPVAALTKIHRALRVGGVVAIKVPKLWGPTHCVRGREWNGFRVGYHTVMFSGETLDNVLRAAGFEPTPAPRRDRPLDDILVVWGRKTAASRKNSAA